MEKKNKNEELQTRREFFKKAASAALPILGAALLASNPIIANANPTAALACPCSGSCKGSCQYACKGCEYTCSGGCKHYACKGVAKG